MALALALAGLEGMAATSAFLGAAAQAEAGGRQRPSQVAAR